MTTNMTIIDLLPKLQREHDKAKEQYTIATHSKNQDKSMYFLGKMDGIEAAMKVLVVEAQK
jgi:hypothetical protein